jgi:pimeloyl-ACP methyl ester carboxylesterase
MQTPVLMVHGMCCTGEVWTQFRQFFEERGTAVYTPTLRPEMRVALSKRPPRELRHVTLSDYVDDLEREVDRIEDETGTTPAVIGHSMGGLLSAALATRGRVTAAVLISPAAPSGIRTFQTNLFWTSYTYAHRWGFTPKVIRPDLRTVSAMVLNVLPAAIREATHGAMVFESGRAFADFANFPIDEKLVRVPTLTVAAGRDRLIPPALVRQTAKKFAAVGGELLEYKNHGHWLYAEPGWETPAADIYGWLSKVTQPAVERRAGREDTAGARV